MAEYWIDGLNGSESNDGLTLGAPKRDWSISISVADGTIVNLARGTTINLTGVRQCTGNYTVRAYGLGAKPVVRIMQSTATQIYANAPLAGPVVQISDIRFERIDTGDIPVAGNNVAFSSIGFEKMVVERCEFIGKFQHGIRLGKGNGSIVRNNYVNGALNGGVYVGITGAQAPSNGLIEGNTIIMPDTVEDNITLHDGTGTASGWKIIGNHCEGGEENCIDVLSPYVDTLVADNTCIAGELSGTSGSGNSVIVISTRARVARNKISSIRTTCIEVTLAGCSGSVIEDNLCLGPYQTMPVGAQFAAHSVTGLAITYRGNSFIGRSANNAAGKAAFGFNASTPDLVFERNIVVRGAGDTTNSTLFWTGGAGPVGTLDRNIYVAASLGLSHYCSKTFSVFKSTFSVDANSIETLTNPLDGTYAPLNPSSAYQVAPLSYPARDVDGRWRNNPACIGAREYVAPRPPRSRS